MVRFTGGARMRHLALFALVVISTIFGASVPARAQLNPYFYSRTCPRLSSIVYHKVNAAIWREGRMAGSLLRLHFHDCFVEGCDGSLLLDDDSRLPKGEKTALANFNSARGFEVIDAIKAAVEWECPRTVSCADILTLAAFWSVYLTGGPFWRPLLGRRDGLTANFSAASGLGTPFNTLPQLKAGFNKFGLSVTDLVALSGAHTLGFARCEVISPRLYGFNGTGPADPTIDKRLLATLEKTCPLHGNGDVTYPLDPTFAKFDNLYYKNLVNFKGILGSDEVLFTEASDTKALVQTYAKYQSRFFTDFAAGMIKMGNINPKTGSNGEIRRNCRKPNWLHLEDAEPLIELELVTDA